MRVHDFPILFSCVVSFSCCVQDERFEQLFKKYARKANIDVHKLVFSFDGEKVDPASTPKDLDMEDDDLIEVHVKAT